MSAVSSRVLLALQALVVAGAITDTVTTTVTATSTATSTATATGATVSTRVDVLGQSGKFTVYNEATGPSSGIQVTMDALREVDSSGSAIGTSGSVKHSINTFAAQDFTIGSPVSVSVGSVPATKVSFDSPVSSIGTIRVDTYVLTGSGMVGPPGEQWAASLGDLKWNIELSGWTWCGCSQGGTVQTGAFVDVDITVKGLADLRQSNSNKTFELGGNMTLELSDQVLVDGNWTAMPTGYPMLTLRGSQATFTFRFPRFSTSALYDPLIGGVLSDSSSEASASMRPAIPWLGAGLVLGASSMIRD